MLGMLLFKKVRMCFLWVWVRTLGKRGHLRQQQADTLDKIAKELEFNDGSSIKDIVTNIRDELNAHIKDEAHQISAIEDYMRETHEIGSASQEAHVNASLHILDVAIFRTDPEGQVFFNNRAHQDLTGFALKQLEGDGWINVIHPDHRESVMRKWREAVAAGREFSEDILYVHPKTGLEYWVHVTVYREVTRSGEILGYLGVVTLK